MLVGVCIVMTCFEQFCFYFSGPNLPAPVTGKWVVLNVDCRSPASVRTSTAILWLLLQQDPNWRWWWRRWICRRRWTAEACFGREQSHGVTSWQERYTSLVPLLYLLTLSLTVCHQQSAETSSTVMVGRWLKKNCWNLAMKLYYRELRVILWRLRGHDGNVVCRQNSFVSVMSSSSCLELTQLELEHKLTELIDWRNEKCLFKIQPA